MAKAKFLQEEEKSVFGEKKEEKEVDMNDPKLAARVQEIQASADHMLADIEKDGREVILFLADPEALRPVRQVYYLQKLTQLSGLAYGLIYFTPWINVAGNMFLYSAGLGGNILSNIILAIARLPDKKTTLIGMSYDP